MRIGGKVSITSISAWLPAEREETPASSDGPRLPSLGLPVLRVKSLPVSTTLAAPEMAVLAAQDCLKQAGRDASELRALIHAHSYHQGHDGWPVAHYIANGIGASPRTLPLAIQHQFCNGALASLDLAAAMLIADAETTTVLLTTADRFCPPAFQRWWTGRPGGFGDGATAALLTRGEATPGALRVLSVAHFSAPHMERVFRGEEGFTPAPMWNKTTLLDTTRLTGQGPSIEDAQLLRDGPRRSLALALADADIEPDDERIRYVALPRIDQRGIDTVYANAFDGLTHAQVVIFGEHTGHLGPGDPWANIMELRDRQLLSPGAIVILVAQGIGFTWSTAVLQVAEG